MLKEFFEIERIEVTAADRLYPEGVTWDLKSGVNVIAGGTGLGKTTLIHATLFALFGAVGSTLRTGQTIDVRYFEGRLAKTSEDDDTPPPVIKVHARFGKADVTVRRDLRTGRLLEGTIDDESLALAAFEQSLAKLLGLSSFETEVRRVVDCLVYLPETPTYYLAWDSLSQNEVLTLLFGDPDDFQTVHDLWGQLSTADSQFRNLRYQAQRLQKEIVAASTSPTTADSAETIAAQRQTLEEARRRGETSLNEASERLAAARADAETAQSAVAELQEQYNQLSSQIASLSSVEQDGALSDLLFASPQTNAVVDALTRLIAAPKSALCPCCAQVPGRETSQLAAVRMALTQKDCPICSSPLQTKSKVKAPRQSQQLEAQIRTVAERLRQALKEHEQAMSRIRVLAAERTRSEESVRQARDAEWAFKVAHPIAGSDQREITLAGLRDEETKAEAARDRLVSKFEKARDALNDKLRKLRNELAKAFQKHCALFLDEPVEIEFDETGERADRRGPQIDPLHSAFYPIIDGEPRYRAEALSTAQRVFVDLAFRMALLTVWSERKKKSVMMVVETPEGSVDTAYMIRVAEMLRSFADGDNQLLVTTNINNSTFLPELMKKTKAKERRDRILNMLDVGNPRPVQKKHRPEFDAVLERAVKGG
ncbi:MAG TPA: AAA family ATPase [Kofleriaceae bacterium]|nr:AAA family ATPase [Kofleriaceae bacterium]